MQHTYLEIDWIQNSCYTDQKTFNIGESTIYQKRYTNGQQPPEKMTSREAQHNNKWDSTTHPLECTKLKNIWQYQVLATGTLNTLLMQKIIWQFPRKFNKHLAYNSTVILLGIYPKEIKTKRQMCTKTGIE